ncbi:WG repeat-containing protein [bacterium 1XD8-76]|nr:WG repeat-containing protein [bacterium 1XD8-76]
MKAKDKKTVFKLAILAMLFLLTGCGGQDGACGMVDHPVPEGEEYDTDVGNIPAEYAEGESAAGGEVDADGEEQTDSTDSSDSIAVISPDGEEIGWTVYSEGVYCYSNVRSYFSDEGGLYGYLSEDGREITPCIYSEAAPFSEGLGCVLLDGKYGYIDKDGETVLPFIYDQASPFREGVAYFSIGEEYGLIDREGNVVLELTDCDSISSFRDGLAYFSADGLYGYMDQSGEVVIEPVYEDAGYFCGGLAVVMRGGFLGVIGRDGGEVLPLEYEDITLGDSCIIARKEGIFYFFDRGGREVSSGDWDKVWEGRDGKDVFYLEKNGKEGLADKDGRIIWNPVYERLTAVPGKEFAIVQNGNGKYGVLDYDGQVRVPFLYSEIRCVRDMGVRYASDVDGLYVTDAHTGKAGYLSGDDFSVKIPVIYDDLRSFMEDRAIAQLDGKEGIVRYDGTVEMPLEYEGLRLFSDGSMAIRRGDMWELTDRKGDKLFTIECDSINEWGDGYDISIDGEYSFYDRQGREVVSHDEGYRLNNDRVFEAENSYILGGSILLKTGREDGGVCEEEVLVNQITPRAGVFAEFMENGSITTDTTGPETTMDAKSLRQCKKFGKLYRAGEGEELFLYFYAKPWNQPMFPESYSGFFAEENGQAIQQITASECGGSMRGDRACLWYDREEEVLKPGTVGNWGGFGGFAYGGVVYKMKQRNAVVENSFDHVEEVWEDGEVSEKYYVGDKEVSEDAYRAAEARYREYVPIR